MLDELDSFLYGRGIYDPELNFPATSPLSGGPQSTTSTADVLGGTAPYVRDNLSPFRSTFSTTTSYRTSSPLAWKSNYFDPLLSNPYRYESPGGRSSGGAWSNASASLGSSARRLPKSKAVSLFEEADREASYFPGAYKPNETTTFSGNTASSSRRDGSPDQTIPRQFRYSADTESPSATVPTKTSHMGSTQSETRKSPQEEFYSYTEPLRFTSQSPASQHYPSPPPPAEARPSKYPAADEQPKSVLTPPRATGAPRATPAQQQRTPEQEEINTELRERQIFTPQPKQRKLDDFDGGYLPYAPQPPKDSTGSTHQNSASHILEASTSVLRKTVPDLDSLPHHLEEEQVSAILGRTFVLNSVDGSRCVVEEQTTANTLSDSAQRDSAPDRWTFETSTDVISELTNSADVIEAIVQAEERSFATKMQQLHALCKVTDNLVRALPTSLEVQPPASLSPDAVDHFRNTPSSSLLPPLSKDLQLVLDRRATVVTSPMVRKANEIWSTGKQLLLEVTEGESVESERLETVINEFLQRSSGASEEDKAVMVNVLRQCIHELRTDDGGVSRPSTATSQSLEAVYGTIRSLQQRVAEAKKQEKSALAFQLHNEMLLVIQDAFSNLVDSVDSIKFDLETVQQPLLSFAKTNVVDSEQQQRRLEMKLVEDHARELHAFQDSLEASLTQKEHRTEEEVQQMHQYLNESDREIEGSITLITRELAKLRTKVTERKKKVRSHVECLGSFTIQHAQDELARQMTQERLGILKGVSDQLQSAQEAFLALGEIRNGLSSVRRKKAENIMDRLRQKLSVAELQTCAVHDELQAAVAQWIQTLTRYQQRETEKLQQLRGTGEVAAAEEKLASLVADAQRYMAMVNAASTRLSQSVPKADSISRPFTPGPFRGGTNFITETPQKTPAPFSATTGTSVFSFTAIGSASPSDRSQLPFRTLSPLTSRQGGSPTGRAALEFSPKPIRLGHHRTGSDQFQRSESSPTSEVSPRPHPPGLPEATQSTAENLLRRYVSLEVVDDLDDSDVKVQRFSDRGMSSGNVDRLVVEELDLEPQATLEPLQVLETLPETSTGSNCFDAPLASPSLTAMLNLNSDGSSSQSPHVITPRLGLPPRRAPSQLRTTSPLFAHGSEGRASTELRTPFALVDVDTLSLDQFLPLFGKSEAITAKWKVALTNLDIEIVKDLRAIRSAPEVWSSFLSDLPLLKAQVEVLLETPERFFPSS